MPATVFVWDMFKGSAGRAPGVGHAALFVESKQGNIYVSFWPSMHRVDKAIYSPGHIHFVNADRLSDGTPSWASKPIRNLDEGAIIAWWRKIQADPIVNYRNKKPFQKSSNEANNFQPATNAHYNIMFNQCSTTVVAGLLAGANVELRSKIMMWCLQNAGKGLGPVQLPTFLPFRVPTVTPKDVRNLVTAIWGDV
jgi:hypothetical protein